MLISKKTTTKMYHFEVAHYDLEDLKRGFKEVLEEHLAKAQLCATKRTPKVLTLKEAAKYLSVKEPTLRNYVHKGLIPSCRPQKPVYFLEEDLYAFVKNGRRKSLDEINAQASTDLSMLYRELQ